jgi:antitoxin (DNA-binding transcriptional repressor) of toxin-antitoxin stability system
MNQITISDFSETIQTLLSQAQKTGDSLTIIKDGVPLAIIQPIKKNKRAAFGVMKNRTKIVGDIVEPTSNLVSWDVLS